MEENNIKEFFKDQVRAILERGANERNGFRAYFADRQPKDEEILSLLAIMVMKNCRFPISDHFPTPFEALAALSPINRAELCYEFRKELKTRFQPMTAA